MSSPTSSIIPRFYRVFFTTLDPIMASSCGLLLLAAPNVVVNAYLPFTTSPKLTARVEEYDTFLHQLAGFCFTLAFIQFFLLRRPSASSDIGTWKILQIGVVITDAVMLASVWYNLGEQGRRSVEMWRLHEWALIGLTGMCLVVRSAFVVGVGMRNAEKVGSKTQ